MKEVKSLRHRDVGFFKLTFYLWVIELIMNQEFIDRRENETAIAFSRSTRSRQGDSG